MKKLVSLVLALLLAATGLMTTALAVDDTPSADEGYYYVYTENGGTLNVRDTPGGTVVGRLKYGQRIYCYYKDGGTGWALIDFTYDKPGYGEGTYACYISSRFLVKTKPPARSKKSASTATTTATTTTAATVSADPLADMNAEFASAKRVTPYKVTIRPSRASGWVPMHWAPAATTTIMATYGANAQLLVLKETNNWLQVEDQDTGDVGFISKTFVAE